MPAVGVQRKKIIFTTKQWSNLSNDYLIATVIPIELPNDEEIEDYAKEFVLSHDFSALTNPNHLANRCFQLGAKWMKEQILNQNKG